MSASQPPRVHGVAEGTRAEQTAGRMGQTSWNCGYWMEALNFHKNLCRCCCEGCFRCDYHLVGLIWSVDGLKSKYEGCQKKKNSPQVRNIETMSECPTCCLVEFRLKTSKSTLIWISSQSACWQISDLPVPTVTGASFLNQFPCPSLSLSIQIRKIHDM